MNKTHIIVHCSDTPHSMKVTTNDLYQWHVIENGWSAIGYAYFIDQAGLTHKCRDLDNNGDVEDEIGAHARGFNKNSIGICLEGRGTYTDEQLDALEYLLDDIRSRHGIPLDNVIGHRDVDPHKECPMMDVHKFVRRRG